MNVLERAVSASRIPAKFSPSSLNVAAFGGVVSVLMANALNAWPKMRPKRPQQLFVMLSAPFDKSVLIVHAAFIFNPAGFNVPATPP